MQIFIEDDSMFGIYICKASNNLGILETIYSLEKGFKPKPPALVQLKSASSDLLIIEVMETDDFNNDNMGIIGYRFIYRKSQNKDDWSHIDFPKRKGNFEISS